MKITKKAGIIALSLVLATSSVISACVKGDGNESSVASYVSESEEEKELKMKINGNEITVKNINKISEGICLLDASFDDTADIEGEFTDAALVGGVIAEVSKSEKLVIPEKGYILRFVGEKTDIAVGDTVTGMQTKETFAAYIEIAGGEYEVSYKNVTAGSDVTGYYYDGYWYSGNSCTGSNRTEIAVGADGKITAINKEGKTDIPDGGYVISAINNTPLARAIEKSAVGDSVSYVENDLLYSAKRMNLGAYNKSRLSNGLAVYTSDKNDTTPICDKCSEFVVDKNGIVVEIFKDDNAINEVPEGGFILSATGDYKPLAERTVKIGAKAIISTDKKWVYITETPETRYASALDMLNTLKEEYSYAAENVLHIDFEKADKVIKEAEKLLEKTDNKYTLAKNTVAARKILNENIAVCMPSVTVADRGAWVTVGELDYESKYIVHYKNREDIKHTVNAAKKLGINNLIVENCAAGYAVYPSDIPGMVMLPDLNGFDVLKAFKEECAAADIGFTVIVVSVNGGSANVNWPEDHYMSIYKDKYLLTNKGNHVSAEKYITLDPADREVRDFEISVIREIIEKYSPDGLQLDYIRYPLPIFYQEPGYEDYGYNAADKDGFIKKYGKDPAKLSIKDPLWEKWCEYRRDIITSYVREISEAVRGMDKDTVFSVTCFADYRDRQIFVYQDVEKWAKEGLVDYVYPMIYGETTEYQAQYAAEISGAKTDDVNIVLGIGTYVRATHESTREQLYMPYEYGYAGGATFTLRYISICGYTDDYIKMYPTAAVPTFADDEKLLPACKEFLSARIDSVSYLSGEGEKLKNAADAVKNGEISVGALDELSVAISESGISEEYKTALEKDIKYIKGIIK